MPPGAFGHFTLSGEEEMAVTNQILFIHGAGEGAYKEDQRLVDSLKDALGDEYRVAYPQMPDTGNPGYPSWKAQLDKELAVVELILVGHSLGASVLLKYLSEEKPQASLIGLFLLAAPYWEAPDWQVDEFTLKDKFAARLPKNLPIYFYHNRDDEIVPFEHLACYKAQLPQATAREYDTGGHQFENGVSEVAQDIKSLMG
jgi:uncharacterized protein